MRLGLAQLNPTVGDLAGNRRKILETYAALVAQGAELVIFPELAVCGYPPRDLLFKRRFVSDVADSLAEPNETFFVNLGNPTNASIAKGHGVGTISDSPQEAPKLPFFIPLARR